MGRRPSLQRKCGAWWTLGLGRVKLSLTSSLKGTVHQTSRSFSFPLFFFLLFFSSLSFLLLFSWDGLLVFVFRTWTPLLSFVGICSRAESGFSFFLQKLLPKIGRMALRPAWGLADGIRLLRAPQEVEGKTRTCIESCGWWHVSFGQASGYVILSCWFPQPAQQCPSCFDTQPYECFLTLLWGNAQRNSPALFSTIKAGARSVF